MRAVDRLAPSARTRMGTVIGSPVLRPVLLLHGHWSALRRQHSDPERFGVSEPEVCSPMTGSSAISQCNGRGDARWRQAWPAPARVTVASGAQRTSSLRCLRRRARPLPTPRPLARPRFVTSLRDVGHPRRLSQTLQARTSAGRAGGAKGGSRRMSFLSARARSCSAYGRHIDPVSIKEYYTSS